MGKVIDQPPDEVDLVWNLVGLPLDEVRLVAKLADLLSNLADLVQDEVRGVRKLVDLVKKLVIRVPNAIDLVPKENYDPSSSLLLACGSKPLNGEDKHTVIEELLFAARGSSTAGPLLECCANGSHVGRARLVCQ